MDEQDDLMEDNEFKVLEPQDETVPNWQEAMDDYFEFDDEQYGGY